MGTGSFHKEKSSSMENVPLGPSFDLFGWNKIEEFFQDKVVSLEVVVCKIRSNIIQWVLSLESISGIDIAQFSGSRISMT